MVHVIPNHTYLVMKMPAPKGILSIRGDTKTSYECDSEAIRLAKLSHQLGNNILLVEEAKKTSPEELKVPGQDPSPMVMETIEKTKAICLDLDDLSKMTLIGSSLTSK
ncbi:unnamed protein product [Urochloa humidicola]